ncbi:MAG: M14 family metallopeptidase [Gammaproteobacteria bacterium]|nr:M14 family metallopeptidase [Gammaproteobacteria bacterium]
MLTVAERLPEGFLDCDARDLHRIVPGPTLFLLGGRREPALFVTVLLHGNETTGLLAVQSLLRRYAPGGGEKPLPRGLALFVGNVAAARRGVRRLAGQPDYNRIWPGGEDRDSPEAGMMREVVDLLRARGLFASVDVHNNSGLNPHYACVNYIDDRYFQLATLFGRTVVYFTRPAGVQSMALGEICPAVTLECGQVGQALGVEHAERYLDACLHLVEVPDHPVAPHDMDLFHTVAVVKVPERIPFDFEPVERGLHLVRDLDHLNFRELPPGTQFGWVRCDGGACVAARDIDGRDVTGAYFDVDGDRLVTRQPVMPSMLTVNTEIIRQDCLCYLMERVDPATLAPR